MAERPNAPSRVPLSALGQKQTFAPQKVISALPPKADIGQHESSPRLNRDEPLLEQCILDGRSGLLPLSSSSFSLQSSNSHQPSFDGLAGEALGARGIGRLVAFTVSLVPHNGAIHYFNFSILASVNGVLNFSISRISNSSRAVP
jgi:hypothetical protein